MRAAGARRSARRAGAHGEVGVPGHPGGTAARTASRAAPVARHDTVHRLFSDCWEAPKLPLLYEVVRILATMAPGADVERMWDRFDRLWLAVERYEALDLGQGFLYDGVVADDWSGDHHG